MHCAVHGDVPGAAGHCVRCLAEVSLGRDLFGSTVGGRFFGDYELLEELGRGGMGVVYRALQGSLGREVALKTLVAADFATEDFRRRFRVEAETSSRLSHPNLVPIYEVGDVDGVPFFTMERIRGRSLDRLERRPAPAVRDCARWVREAALGVAHAHAHGVLHRDLKPSNLLLDEWGTVRVADLGVAAVMDPGASAERAATVAGSPPWMAPEQVRADATGMGPATDVYGLGAVLYDLLTGRPPFMGSTPRDVLFQVVAGELVPPRRLNPSVPVDLETICLKSLSREPARRYAGAVELAADLGRFLEGRPIVARPAGIGLRLRRWAGRNPALAAVSAGLGLALFFGVAGVLWQWRAAVRFAGSERTQRRAAEAALSDLRESRYVSDMSLAAEALRVGDKARALEILERMDPEADGLGDDLRGFEWGLFRALAEPAPSTVLETRAATVTSVAFSPDGKRVLVCDQSGLCRLWTGFGGGETAGSEAIGGQWEWAAWAASGRWLVGAGPGGEVEVRDAVTGSGVWRTWGRHFVLGGAGRRERVVLLDALPYPWWEGGGPVRVHDLADGARVWDEPGAWRSAALSPDGALLVLSGVESGMRWIPLDGGEGTVRDIGTPAALWGLAFSSDGAWLAACGRRGVVVWNVGDPGAVPRFLPHPITVWKAAFLPGARRIVTAASDRRLRLWDLEGGGVVDQRTAHSGEVWTVAVSPDGGRWLSGGRDCDVRVWEGGGDVDGGEGGGDLAHTAFAAPVFSEDGTRLVTTVGERSRVWGLGGAHPEALWEGPAVGGVTADGSGAWRVGADGLPGVVSLKQSDEGNAVGGAGGGLAFLRPWLVFHGDAHIGLHRVPDGALEHRLPLEAGGGRRAVAVSRDGCWAAVAETATRGVAVYGLEAGTRDPDLRWRLTNGTRYGFVGLDFSHDGRWLAGADLEGPVVVWDVESGGVAATLAGHPEGTAAVGFSPDDRTLVSSGMGLGLDLWRTGVWRPVGHLPIENLGQHLAFSPDGRWLAVTVGGENNRGVMLLPGGAGWRR